MATLSFESGIPIARVKGGKYHKKIIYLKEKIYGDKEKEEKGITHGKLYGYDPLEFLIQKGVLGKNKYKKFNMKDAAQIVNAIKRNKAPDDDSLLETYKDAKYAIRHQGDKEFSIHDGQVIPLPNPDKRECIYVSAPSGSGKSTWCANYIREFQLMYPDREVYIFSRLAKDPVLDKLNPIRMIINEKLVEEPIDPSEIPNSLVLFDDCDTIPDKKQKQAVLNLRNDLLETGRHDDIFVLCTSHYITNHKETKVLLNESSYVTFFPSSSGQYTIRYFLKTYCGLGKNEINKIMGLPSRWVTIRKIYPMMIIYQSGCYVLGQ